MNGAQEDRMQIAEVMTRSVDLADPNMKLRSAAQKMQKDDIGALPVGENDRLVGMVTDRDIVMRGVTGGRSTTNMAVRDVMSEKICYCFEDQSLEEAADLMAKHQVHRLPVLNRDKRLVGIIALADLARNGAGGAKAALKALCGIAQESGVPRRV
jgi:CBS domain-containing protein